ncbi:NAD(+) diphosphatase [Desulfogranum marinum]|uniref:NAD(+) diphosphatase n=1 Tax=Desulfogranum marinum TaxID=453220 RepID=UPI001962844E|nr:NAD(+) diphosphatase [Desulfogranum marinum]
MKRTLPEKLPAGCLFFIFLGDSLLIHQDGDQLTLPSEIPEPLRDKVTYHRFLNSNTDLYPSLVVDLNQDTTLVDATFISLRSLYPHIENKQLTQAGRALQILRWNRNHQYCSRCGQKVKESCTEPAKICNSCGLVSYPRISPAVIMSIIDGDRILLARNRRFSAGKYSPLAGFVEAGETMEQAVRREILEEVNLKVDNITYFGSQPWPFPHSMMVGFTTRYSGGLLQIDNDEIVDAQWFTRDRLPPILPPQSSIARKLVDHFLSGQ